MFRNFVISAVKNWLLLLALLAGVPAWAQVSMDLSLNHQSYIQFEQVMAKLSIRNFSGHPLIFGESKELSGTIAFQITGPNGEVITLKSGQKPSLTGILIETGKTNDAYISLSEFYPLFAPGRYTVRAQVTHPQMTRPFVSNTVGFNISRGSVVWEHMVGVPDILPEQKKNPRDAIKERKYRIYSLYDNIKNYFYLSVEDEDLIYSIQRIGVEMSRSSPQCEVDRFSRLHILMPTNPRVSSYFIFGPDGKQEKRVVYRKTTTTPTLVRKPDTGEVIVAGGQEARAGVDYKDELAESRKPTTAEKPELVPDLPEPAAVESPAPSKKK